MRRSIVAHDLSTPVGIFPLCGGGGGEICPCDFDMQNISVNTGMQKTTLTRRTVGGDPIRLTTTGETHSEEKHLELSWLSNKQTSIISSNVLFRPGV